MTYLVYNTLLIVAAPLLRLYLRARPRYRTLLARFAPPLPRLASRPIWVHACSVGEVTVAKPLMAKLQERFPGVSILLTTSTVGGYELARKQVSGTELAWCPFDLAASVRKFIQRARPRILVLVETEIWPNLVREARRADIPVVLVNGRLSEKHFARYRRFQWCLKQVFSLVSAAGMQTEEYARRIVQLGAHPDGVQVAGSIKFDTVQTELDAHTRARLRRALGVQPGHPILIFGSTRPGDEALAGTCWRALRDAFPGLSVIVAPRHMDRLPDAIRAFDEPVLRRSEILDGKLPSGARVIILDTVGELVQFYAIADVAVIGGSFFPGVEGHNPLEPAALGVPTVFGPYMKNFPEPAEVLREENGAIQVQAPEELPEALRRLLADPAECRRLGTRGRRAVLSHRGALARNVELIARIMRSDG